MTDFHDLYQRYQPDVYRFAYWLTGNAAQADDITAETFVRAWTLWEDLRLATAKAYLFTIARNLFLQQARHAAREVALEPGLPDTAPGPEQLTERRAELQAIRRILQGLPEIDRAAFLMRVQDEFAYETIAQSLHISVAAAKVKVHRVRLKLAVLHSNEEAS